MSARKPHIRFTPEADDDVKNISLYTWQNWGEAQATIYEARIAQALESLRDHPHMGHPREDLFPGCRSVMGQRHVIFYHLPNPGEIEVVRILHEHQHAAAVRPPQ
jgi:toxin ParE1/3/4